MLELLQDLLQPDLLQDLLLLDLLVCHLLQSNEDRVYKCQSMVGPVYLMVGVVGLCLQLRRGR